MKKITLAIMLSLFFAIGVQAQNRYHVKEDGDDTTNDGSTWATAFATLQKAIDSASDGETIFVAKGTYTQTVEYLLNSKNVKIYGSFEGWESSPDQRTFASGHSSVLNAGGTCRVFSLDGRTNATVIDGFKITGGYGYDGTGIRNQNSSPVLANLTISGNTASYNGGGMYNYDLSSPVLTNVTISGNTASYGGGMYNYTNSSPTLTNVTISGNTATTNGGGMYNIGSDSNPKLYNSIVLGNSSGVYNISSIPVYSHSLVQDTGSDSNFGYHNGTDWDDKTYLETDVFVSSLSTPGKSTGGDFRLKLNSTNPAIDKGNNSYNNEPVDLDGNNRIYNGIIDLGAYESALQPPKIPTTYYTLTVTDGSGSGSYTAGQAVSIAANTAPDGQVFDHWESNGGSFADEKSPNTTFTMPNSDVTVTAVFVEYTDPDTDTEPAPNPNDPVIVPPAPTPPTPTPTPPPIIIVSPSTQTIITNPYPEPKQQLYEFRDVKDDDTASKPWVNPFKDVKSGDWHYENVKYMCENGLMIGTSADTFSPNDPMTYGMVLTILGRMAKTNVVEGEIYYEPYVNWARENGLLNGIEDFDPEKYITREDLAVLLYNYAKLKGLKLPETKDEMIFSDESEISEYAVEAVAAMQRAGVINGRTDGTFDPQSTATRAEVAAMFHRFIEAVK